MQAALLLLALLFSPEGDAEGLGSPGPEEARREVFDTLYQEGLSAYSKGDYPRCAELLQGANGVHPDAAAYRVLGFCLVEMGRWEDAIVAEEMAVFYDPGDPRSLTSLATLYFAAGKLLQANYRVEQAIAVDPVAVFPQFLRVLLWDTLADSPLVPRREKRKIKERIVETGRDLLDEKPGEGGLEGDDLAQIRSEIRERVEQRKGELERDETEEKPAP